MSLPLPIPGADPDTWGPKLNAYLQDLDSRVGGAGVPGAQVVTGPFATTSGSYGPADRTVKTTYTNGPNRRLVLVHYGYANLGPATVDMVAHTVIGGINKTIVIDTVPAGDTSTVATHVTRVGMFPVDPHGTYGFEGTGTVNGDQPSVVSWIEVDSPADLSVLQNQTLTRLGLIPANPDDQHIDSLTFNKGWANLFFYGNTAQSYPNGYGAGPGGSSLATDFSGLNNIGLKLHAGNHGGFSCISTYSPGDKYPRWAVVGEGFEFSNGLYPPDAIFERRSDSTQSFTMVGQDDTNPAGDKRQPGNRLSILAANASWPSSTAEAFPNVGSAAPAWSFINAWSEFHTDGVFASHYPTSGFRIGGMLDLANVGFLDHFGSQVGAGYHTGAAPVSPYNRSGDKIVLSGDEISGRSVIGYTASKGAVVAVPRSEALIIADTDLNFTKQAAANTSGLGLQSTQMLLPRASPKGTSGSPALAANHSDFYTDSNGNLCWRDDSGLIHVLALRGAIAPGLPGLRQTTVTITGGSTTNGINGVLSPDPGPNNLRTNDGNTSYAEMLSNAAIGAITTTLDAAAAPAGSTLTAQRLVAVLKSITSTNLEGALQVLVNNNAPKRLAIPFSTGGDYVAVSIPVPLDQPLSAAVLGLGVLNDAIRITQVYAELDYTYPATS